MPPSRSGAKPGAPSNPRDTPAMRQYYGFKRQHPDCLLLFRIGDFYEMFDDDAVAASRAIGLTLTQRTEGVPMAGVPYHQLETYLRRFIDAGFRVAVCEQTQDAAEAKSGGKAVIERAVDRVITPGTLVDDSLLPGDRVARLAAVCFLESGETSAAALAVVDLSTGSFIVRECAGAAGGVLVDELARRGVTEVLYAEPSEGIAPSGSVNGAKRAPGAGAPTRVAAVLTPLGLSGTPRPSWQFRQEEALEAIREQYGVSTLGGFGLSDDDPTLRPVGAIIRYLRETQAAGADGAAGPALAHLRPPLRESPDGFCIIDATTLRSLEILRTIRGGGAAGGRGGPEADGSLLGIFSTPGCRTAMGRRLLREWLCYPLCHAGAIRDRHRAVGLLVEDRRTADTLTAALADVQDVPRIAGRIALGRATPRDVVALGRSLAKVTPIAEATSNAPALARLHESISATAGALAPMAERIAHACVDSPPSHLRDGGLIRDGVDAELDEARLLRRDAAAWMADYQKRLIEEHSLPSLKVGYNKVFGYFIELPAAQSKRAPDVFTRKQTLKGAERYITPELKQFEEKVGTAEARAKAREEALFEDLCRAAAALAAPISAFAEATAELDVLACFAGKAHRRRWVMPEMVDEAVLMVHEGRHPVLDELLEGAFVPNDAELGRTMRFAGDNPASQAVVASDLGHPAPRLALVTGPNMAGKSTYIRQVALIALLAHAGSFVPADRAVVGLTDRIFTRLGADDALHAGQSTFMVEMTETARILNHCTARSLIVLDEIGRGTSTLDGLSLAWAIAERLAGDDAEPGPRTFFATHYHELTDLSSLLPGRVTNLHVAVREWGEEIVFLHRIEPGATDQSYGVHVAKLAGIPAPVISRAREVLDNLAVHHHRHSADPGAATPSDSSGSPRRGPSVPPPTTASQNGQLALFTEFLPHPAVDQLREMKIESLSPLQAFDALRRLKDMTAGSSSAPG